MTQPSMKLNTLWNKTTQWLTGRTERSLEQAFQAALQIKELEDHYFQGHKVSADSIAYGASVITYFTTEVKQHLQTIQVNLAAFKKTPHFQPVVPDIVENNQPKDHSLKGQDEVNYLLEKLQFIDGMVARYSTLAIESASSIAIAAAPLPPSEILPPARIMDNQRKARPMPKNSSRYLRPNDGNQKLDSASRKTGMLPRSFLRTLNRLKQEMDPQSDEKEEEVLNQYRSARYKTTLSVKFLLMLIIIPLLTHQLTKTFFLTPIVEKYFDNHLEMVFLNQSLETEAFAELKHFEDTLRFQGLIQPEKRLSTEEIDERLKEKAQEISNSYRHVGANAIANIFADLLSLIAFVIVLVSSREEIEVVKEFIDEIVYGLSDSAKAFLIILFTDMFVGFHSPHGWEVILESIARHFGLPENRDFNFLFIATFPVILDTVFKYWIFRYLNSISPSSVATYRNMNE
jgi:hypothetical protein